MKASQKGMKLNDIRYFRQPRPYTRKRIPKMRLFPDLASLDGSVIKTSEDQISSANHRTSSGKSRGRCLTVHCDQRSREIACISYTSDSDESQVFNRAEENNQNNFCDTPGTTDPEKEIFISQLETKDLENAKFRPKPESEKEIQVEMELEVAEKNIGVEELHAAFLVPPEVSRETEEEIKRKIADEMPQVGLNKNSSDSAKSSWFRYSAIRKILDFFGHLLGKSDSVSHDNEVTRTLETRQFVDRSVNNFNNPAKLKKPGSSMKNRAKKSSKYKSVPRRTDTPMKRLENVEFSGLTRQLINTRDKRLRATLMEHEMRARKLEEENRRYRRILKEKFKIRQMSSPLH